MSTGLNPRHGGRFFRCLRDGIPYVFRVSDLGLVEASYSFCSVYHLHDGDRRVSYSAVDAARSTDLKNDRFKSDMAALALAGVRLHGDFDYLDGDRQSEIGYHAPPEPLEDW